MSVLVDTSVWLRFLSGKEPFRRALDELLSRDAVVAHDLVYGELLIGDVGGLRRGALTVMPLMTYAQTVAHEEVVALVRAQRLHGRGIGWVDAQLLASCLAERLLLWTADDALEQVAGELGIRFAVRRL
ncbi:MAG: PIN domain-containing protein [Myxococcales bacterium]|nr:PIN domain-containing protein [Myxococcales bacterium]